MMKHMHDRQSKQLSPHAGPRHRFANVIGRCLFELWMQHPLHMIASQAMPESTTACY